MYYFFPVSTIVFQPLHIGKQKLTEYKLPDHIKKLVFERNLKFWEVRITFQDQGKFTDLVELPALMKIDKFS